MRHVISLSTIPPRFDRIGPCLQSLLRQKLRPEAIELYIPQSYRRFPQWGGGLPQVPEGVRIIRVEQDFGPATKALPAVCAYRGQDIDILYVDDDHVYARDWSQRCAEVRREHPDKALCAAGTSVELIGRAWRPDDGPQPRAVHARRNIEQWQFQLRRLLWILGIRGPGQAALQPRWRKLRQSGHMDIAEGYAGVAIRPEFLDDAALTIPPVIWAVDDVWISGHLARRGVPIWADRRLDRAQMVLEASRAFPLYKAVLEGADRPTANLACVDYMRDTYGIWGGVATQST